MPRVCSVCGHAERATIDELLIAGGASLRNIAQQFQLSPTALFRHREHIPAALAKAQEAQDVAQADDLLAQVRSLQAKTLGILAQAERAGELRTALLAIREARGGLELLAKLLGELDERPQVNVLIAPEWLTIRTTLLQTLRPYAEARAVVAAALIALEAGKNGKEGNDGHVG